MTGEIKARRGNKGILLVRLEKLKQEEGNNNILLV
jgi:hypothetical protein